MIRKLQHLCCAMLALTMMVACSTDDDPIVVRSISLSSHAAVFGAEGGSTTIDIAPYPEAMAWESRTEKSEWFDINISGNSMTITAKANTSTAARRGEVVIFSPEGDFEQETIGIAQEGATAVALSHSAAEEHRFDSEGDKYVFNIASNYEWRVTVDVDWISVSEDYDGGRATLVAEANTSFAERSATATITAGEGDNTQSATISLRQGTHDDNPYFKLLGKWEITADKWLYTTNGSLNSMDGSPSASQYYLIFDIEEGEYNKTLYMRNFLYPGTSLEVRYDPATESFVIPFGWSVYAYEVFLYITLVSGNQFSYAALEVPVVPSGDYTILTPKMPSVSGYNYVGFGLWAYGDNGEKEAFGSNMYPTMYPMSNIKFIKHTN